MRVLPKEKLDQVENYIKTYAYQHNGDVPSLSDIMTALDIPKATAYRYLVRLRENGRIDYNGKGTLELKPENGYVRKCGSARVPIFGSVICGTPTEEEQYNEGYLAIPEEWMEEGVCFLLRARGDSMIGIGVEEGDLVLVKRTQNASEGQIVVALTPEGNTLKRLSYENGRPVLLADNDSYPDSRRILRPASLQIQGVAIKIIKDIPHKI